jgi:hypothetical protein
MMGANTTVYVRVVKAYTEWVEVQAVTLADAEQKARELPGVVDTIDSSYSNPAES